MKKNYASKRSDEHQKAVEERRRSNAAGTHNSYKKYVDEKDSLKEELDDYKESTCL
jgi:hypothetical protein